MKSEAIKMFIKNLLSAPDEKAQTKKTLIMLPFGILGCGLIIYYLYAVLGLGKYQTILLLLVIMFIILSAVIMCIKCVGLNVFSPLCNRCNRREDECHCSDFGA